MATDHNFIVKNGLEVGGQLIVNSSGELVLSTVNSNLTFNDNVKAQFGSGNDLQIYHNATDSAIENNTGDLYITNKADDKNIIFRSDNGSGGYEEYFRLDGGLALTNFSKHTRHNDAIRSYYGNSNDAEITHTGAQFVIQGFNGDMKMINYHDDGDIIFGSDNGSGGTATYLTIDGGTTTVKFSKKALFLDNVEATFGGNTDLRIVHDGTDSTINNFQGDLVIRNNFDDGDIKFYSDDSTGGLTEYMRIDGGITKTIFSRDTKHLDDKQALFGTNDDLRIKHNGTIGTVDNFTGALLIRQQVDDNDVIIQSDNGSGGVANYFMADGSSGQAKMYHYGDEKLTTESWGVNVQGEIQGDSLDIDGSSSFDGAITVSNGTGTNTIVNLNGSATTYLEKDTGTDFYIANNVQDRDIFLRVNAGSTNLAAQQIDASLGGRTLFSNTNAAAEIVKFGGSTQTNYTNVKFDTNTLTDQAYIIAYGDGNPKDKQFAMKNTNTSGKIFFQVGTLEPLTLTTTGAEFRGNTFSMQATGSVRFNLNADTDNAGTENDDAEISFTQDGSHNMLHVGGNGSAASPNHTGLLDNSAYIMSGDGHSGGVPLQFGTNSTAKMILTTNGYLGVGTQTPEHRLHLVEASLSNDRTFITLEQRDDTGDVGENKSFIDFRFRDGNPNEYPQVRIGAQVGPNSDSDTQVKEGKGAFVVYTNNSTTDGSTSTTPSGMAERMRVDYRGYVGIGTSAPTNLLTVTGGTEIINVNLTGNTQRLTIGSDGSWNYFKGKSGNGHKFTTTGGGDLSFSNTGALVLSAGTSNRTVQLLDNGLYISRTTDGANTSQITADTNNGNDLAIKVRSALRLYHNSAHKYTFTETGFGVNKTSPDFGLCLSHNQDNAGLNSGVMLSFDPSTSTDPAGYRFKSQVSGGSTGYYQVLYDGAEIAWNAWDNSSSSYPTRMRLSNAGNLALGTTTSSTVRLYVKGSTSNSSADALQIEDSTGQDIFRVVNDGRVLINDNYLYVSSSSGAFFDGSIKARGGISNDQGDLLLNDNVDLHGQLQVWNGTSSNKIRLYTEQSTAQIADTLADVTTQKSYIYFLAGASSNDPGYIMHETSNSETNEGILHLVPSDDNATNDYVSIHGTDDADCIRLHTSGLIETGTNHTLTLKSGSGDVNLNDNVTVGYNLTVEGNLVVNGSSTTLNVATLEVEDKNIVINRGSGDTSSTADGAGITIQDAVNSSTDATILWNASSDHFTFSHDIVVPRIVGTASNGSSLYALGLSRSSSGTTTPDLWGSSGTLVLGSSSSDEALAINGQDVITYGKLTMNQKGFSVDDAYYAWKRAYSVTNTSPQEILDRDGNSLSTGGNYRFTAHISGTGTDNFAGAVFWNENGTWRYNVTGQSGTNSNHPEFIIDATTNKPTIRIDHTSTYTIHIYHEHMRLNEESSGTDNKGYGFGTDGFLGSVNDILRYKPNGTADTGVDQYADGYTVWHSGNDGASSGLHADLLDGQHGSYYAPIAGPAFTGNSSFAGNLGVGITSPVARLDVKGEGTGPTVHNYLYASGDGIRVHGEESAIDIVGSDAGNHASSLLLRNGNEGFSILNEPADDSLKIRSFTATGNNFHAHAGGDSVSGLTDILTLTKAGNIGIGNTAPSAKLEIQGQSTSSTYQGTGPTGTVLRVQANSGTPWITTELNGASTYIGPENSTTAKFAAYNYATSAEMNIKLGQSRMYIKSDGNVGVGTTDPSYRLDVKGYGPSLARFVANNNADDALVRIIGGNYNTEKDARLYLGENDVNGMTIEYDGVANIGYIGMNDNVQPNLAFSKRIGMSRSGSEVFFTAGNVGIGTSVPDHKLHIESTNDSALRLTRTGVRSFRQYVSSSGHFIIRDLSGTPANRLSINTSGNVGIGTDNAGYKLQVAGSTMIGDPSAVTSPSFGARQNIVSSFSHGANGIGRNGSLYLLNTNTNGQAGFLCFGAYSNHTNNLYYQTGGIGGGTDAQNGGSWGGYLSFWTTSDGTAGATSGQFEHMRITADGNVGIGTINPVDILTIKGDGKYIASHDGANYAFRLGADSSGDGNFILYSSTGAITHKLYGESNAINYIDNGGNFGIGTTTPDYKLEVNGSFAATTKSFDIEHPTKEGMRLHHGVLEGPEHSVYVRGRTNDSTIKLPEYWTGLVYEDTITVQLTAIGKSSELYVKDISDNSVVVSNDTEYFYYIMAERKDVDRFEVEYGDSV